MNHKRIRLLMGKEFKQLRRDKLLLRIALLMPIAQLIMMGYVIAADVQNLPTAVIDLDRSQTSRQLTSEFAESGYFAVTHRPTSESDLPRLLDTSTVKVAIVIPEGTQARLDRGESAPVGVIVDGTDNVSASVGSGYAAQIIARFNAARIRTSGLDVTAAPGLDTSVRVLYNPTLSTVNSMIPGLIAVLMMISISVIMSQAVVKERESGTLEQLFVTPIRPMEYLIGKVTPYMVLAVVQATLVAVLGSLWFRVPFAGSVLVVSVGIGLFLLVCVGQGLLISLAARTRAQAQQIVMLSLLPAMILSGFIFPVQSMPPVFQFIAQFIPLTHALTVMRGAFVKGSGFGALAVPLAWLAGFAVVLFGAAVAATHRRITE